MKYLKLFVDCLEKYHRLNDAEFGRLIRAALTYKATGEEVMLNGREELLWDGMKLDIDRAESAYNSIANSRSEAGKKGAARRWENDGKCHNDDGKNSKCHFPDGKNSKCHKEKEKEKEKIKENITAVAVIKENGKNATTTTDGMPFGLTEADIDASLSQDQRIEDACKTWALPCSAGNIAESRDLIREYGEEWVMQAIQIAGNNRPTWGYVKGVLATAKRNGSMNLPQKRAGKTVSAQQYQQREYTEEELLSIGDDLIEEARQRRGTNGT